MKAEQAGNPGRLKTLVHLVRAGGLVACGAKGGLVSTDRKKVTCPKCSWVRHV